ncbi:MAG: glycosyltransferase [Clostridia bacterium]|nr:glycosyltransferase [Clostridia bacterium]
MAKIFINGLNAKAGGGKSIFTNYLTLLNNIEPYNKYFVLTPNTADYIKFANKNIVLIDIPGLFKKTLLYPFVYTFYLNKILKKYCIDVVFNLADIPIKTKTKQVFLFDWSYAVYPESIVWNMMDYKSKLNRKAKLFLFKKNIIYIDLLIAQTETMKKRLENIYKNENIKIVPNAVSLENLANKSKHDFNLPLGIKLLYLTHYYPHKNLEIFIPIAQKIKKEKLPYKLIITIKREQHKGAKLLLNTIENLNLTDFIINVGSVEMKHVPSLYEQCDGLLMPTLLESFSGTYVEAMHHKIPIFTSDIDFAHGVCGKAATYFDPFNATDIINKVHSLYSDIELKTEKIKIGSRILKELPDWAKTFQMYNEAIESTLISNP